MRVRTGRLMCLWAVLLSAIGVAAQERSGADPRVGLKAGFRDAAEAVRNMERVASLSKPEGFFNPSLPA